MKIQAFVICISNKGYPASLEVRKLYQYIPDEMAEKMRQIRVIDESGEDYYYPAEFFMPIELSQQMQVELLKAA